MEESQVDIQADKSAGTASDIHRWLVSGHAHT
jgi:hypothetical protein